MRCRLQPALEKTTSNIPTELVSCHITNLQIYPFFYRQPIACMMARLTMEEQKEIYARDLAAYTLRQWHAVRKVVEEPKTKVEPSVSSPNTTPDSGYHEPSKKNRNSYTVDNAIAGMTVLPLYA